MGPFFVLFVVVFLIPVATAVWLSFFSDDEPGLGFGPESTVFVGLRTLTPVSLSGQGPASAPDAVVWHWFGDCASGDSLVLDVTLDGKADGCKGICEVTFRPRG